MLKILAIAIILLVFYVLWHNMKKEIKETAKDTLDINKDGKVNLDDAKEVVKKATRRSRPKKTTSTNKKTSTKGATKKSTSTNK